jgi:ribonuclease HII
VPLIYCGIDEAGYGPTLGPLCVGCATFRVDGWSEGDPAPDLWQLLARAVCRQAGDKRHRIAVDDSKKLKLANSSVRHHPLHHLERGVLSFLACAEGSPCGGSGEGGAGGGVGVPADDLAFLAAAGVSSAAECWYAGEGSAFPCGQTAGEIAIAANTLRLALSGAGISLMSLRAEAVSESVFNELVDAAGTKAAVTESVLVRYLADVWDKHAAADAEGAGDGGGGGVRVVCDRQGGRTQYAQMLAHAFPDADITIVAETPLQSKYELRSRPAASQVSRRMSVSFKVEAESAHMPVALASMIAKLTREVLMARFNRYWCNRIPELKPTAGYALDARRWLKDVHEIITPQERRALVRRA